MTAQAGWYPDPSGKADKLRFWDGNAWTNDFMDTAAVQPKPGTIAQTPLQPLPSSNAEQPTSAVVQTTEQGQQTYEQPASYASQPQDQAYTGQQSYYQQPSYNVPASSQSVMNPDGTYVVESTDATLRLVAFILYMIEIGWVVLSALATLGLSLICLAWLIPMGIHCWSVYKGQKPNTIAFGVCTLIFSNLIAGILLLISKKDV